MSSPFFVLSDTEGLEPCCAEAPTGLTIGLGTVCECTKAPPPEDIQLCFPPSALSSTGGLYVVSPATVAASAGELTASSAHSLAVVIQSPFLQPLNDTLSRWCSPPVEESAVVPIPWWTVGTTVVARCGDQGVACYSGCPLSQTASSVTISPMAAELLYLPSPTSETPMHNILEDVLLCKSATNRHYDDDQNSKAREDNVTPPSLSLPSIHDVILEDHKGARLTSNILCEDLSSLKWQILPFTCLLTFGLYYTMDFPASIGTGDGATIQSRFRSEGKQFNQAMNQALYSVYSYPNTVLAVFGGLLIDKYIGLRKSMVLFVSLILAGAGFFLLGVIVTNYPLMMFARVLFGLGGESLSVAQSAFVARWFRGGRGMALAFGITISFSRVGSSFNFLFSPLIADSWNVQIACLAGVIACAVSVCACVVLILADVHAVNKGLIKAEAVGGEGEGEVMKLSDLLKLPLELWLICFICIFCYCSIFPFVGIAKNYFQVKYGLSGADASNYISFYQFASAAASPVIGFVVDQTGRYTLWLILASCCFIAIHLLFLLTSIPPYVLTTIMGFFYSFLVSGLWPSVPFAVPENMCGMAYGIITALQNAGLATFPLITGAILDAYTSNPRTNTTNVTTTTTMVSTTTMLTSTVATSSSMLTTSTAHPFVLGDDDDDGSTALPDLKGFKLTEMVFIISASASLLGCIFLLIVDKAHGGILSANPTDRKELVAARDEERRGLLNEDGYSPKGESV